MADRITEDGRMKEETILQLNHVDRIYEDGDTRVQALSDVNLKVRKGEFISLLTIFHFFLCYVYRLLFASLLE